VFPSGVRYVRQALAVAATLLVAGLALVYFGWSRFWEVFCFALGLVMVLLALRQSYTISERKV